MCGIVGMFDLWEKSQIDGDLLARMNQTQYHRGPDEGGLHREPGVGLGHRRLSIIDLSSGQQPLANEDGSVIVVYNGEIYNYPALTEELVQKGHVFRTHCDTEVIVHAWEEWGKACVDRFRGMFAFALWDRQRETLFLARDRLGIKPLHYAMLSDGQFIFASEIKAILAHPSVPKEIDPKAMEDYFAYGYIPDPKTIYRAVHKLPPGHVLTLKRGARSVKPEKYWDVSFRSSAPLNEAEAAEELIARLQEAIKIRLVAEVPLGAFLSGGVDSSAVVALMAQLSDQPVNTCSISFGAPGFNEAHYAARVAERYRTNHQIKQVDPDDFDLIDRLAGIYDEPFADNSAMPTYRVCELARQKVTVALSGDGGDENFAGYRRYRWHLYEETCRSLLPARLRHPLFGALGKLYPKADWAPKVLRAKTTFEALAREPLAGYFNNSAVINDTIRQRLYSEPFKRSLKGYHALQVLQAHARQAPADHPLSQVQYLDLKTYLAGDILTKVDRASMAHSLEVRVPILDHLLVEWVAGLPPEMKLKGREGKYLFKKALRPHLPDEILYRSKMGFSIPMAHWFRGPLRQRLRDSLLGPVLKGTGFFDMNFIEHMVAQHQAGYRDYSAPLWSLLMFESFYRQAMG